MTEKEKLDIIDWLKDWDIFYSQKEVALLAKNTLQMLNDQQARIQQLEEQLTAKVLTLEEVCGWTKGEPLFIEEETPGFSVRGYNVYRNEDYQYVCFAPFDCEASYYLKEDYGLMWRCWTSKPTDKQREATPWK